MQGGVVLQSSVSYPLVPPPRTTSLVSHQLMTTARDQSSASDPPHQMRSARATMRKHPKKLRRLTTRTASPSDRWPRFSHTTIVTVIKSPPVRPLLTSATHLVDLQATGLLNFALFYRGIYTSKESIIFPQPYFQKEVINVILPQVWFSLADKNFPWGRKYWFPSSSPGKNYFLFPINQIKSSLG